MFSRRGSGGDHGGGGVERDTAVSLSSAAHKRTVHTRNVCVPVCGSRICVCVCVSICVVTLWFVFFLYRWFCPLVCVSGSVSFPCRDGLVGCTRRRRKVVGPAAPVSCGFVFHSAPSCGLSLSICVSLFTFCLHHSPLRASTALSFFTLVGESLSIFIFMFPSIRSVSLPHAAPPPLHLSLLCHFFATSISRAGTPEETATPKNSATTIMSTLSSHNNTRINLPSGLGGRGRDDELFWGQSLRPGYRGWSVNTSQTCTCGSVKYGVEFPPLRAVFRSVSEYLLCQRCIFVFQGWDVVVRCQNGAHLWPLTHCSLFWKRTRVIKDGLTQSAKILVFYILL